PLGSELRAAGVRNRIGFFLHTPWPATRLLVSLPGHRALVERLFAYDVIGFQSSVWLHSFLYYVREHFEDAEVADDGRIVIGLRVCATASASSCTRPGRRRACWCRCRVTVPWSSGCSPMM